jgi:hypothetical protein
MEKPFENGGKSMTDEDPPRGLAGFQVDSLIQLPDDNRIVRHGPVFDNRRDARWYAKMARKAHIPAWVVRV